MPSLGPTRLRAAAAAALLTMVQPCARALAEPGADGVGCGAKAALFTGAKAFKLWVTRSGSMQQGNPLRPLDAVTVQVLEVRIGNKSATAYGPDFAMLRRGLSPAELQAANGGAPIEWAQGIDAVPRALRIVAEDGAPLAEMQFDSCGDAPTAAPVAARRPAARPRAAPKPTQTPPGIALPQGAIP